MIVIYIYYLLVFIQISDILQSSAVLVSVSEDCDAKQLEKAV